MYNISKIRNVYICRMTLLTSSKERAVGKVAQSDINPYQVQRTVKCAQESRQEASNAIMQFNVKVHVCNISFHFYLI